MRSASISHRHSTALTLAFLAVLLSGAARAAVPAAAIRYLAPPECPGPFKFLSLVEERTAGRWQVRQSEGDFEFVVEIREGATGKVGRVRRADRPAEGAREIAAADCGDLVQALALSTVLSLDEVADARGGGAGTVVAAKGSIMPEAQHSSWMVGAGASNTFLLPSDAMPGVSVFIGNGRGRAPRGIAIGRPDLRLALTHARNDLFGGDRASFTTDEPLPLGGRWRGRQTAVGPRPPNGCRGARRRGGADRADDLCLRNAPRRSREDPCGRGLGGPGGGVDDSVIKRPRGQRSVDRGE